MLPWEKDSLFCSLFKSDLKKHVSEQYVKRSVHNQPHPGLALLCCLHDTVFMEQGLNDNICFGILTWRRFFLHACLRLMHAMAPEGTDFEAVVEMTVQHSDPEMYGVSEKEWRDAAEEKPTVDLLDAGLARGRPITISMRCAMFDYLSISQMTELEHLFQNPQAAAGRPN